MKKTRNHSWEWTIGDTQVCRRPGCGLKRGMKQPHGSANVYPDGRYSWPSVPTAPTGWFEARESPGCYGRRDVTSRGKA